MSDPFLGEIRMFAGTYAPVGWDFCDGQLLAISQNEALFSLFGTTYGGNGRTTFALPDMRGRIPVHMGQGMGLSNRALGRKSGTESVTLSPSQIPSHRHTIKASGADADQTDPSNRVAAVSRKGTGQGRTLYGDKNNAQLKSDAFTSTGASQGHSNLMPALCIHFIVALVGTFPSRE
ncbi:MAG: phage tail protein [Candidatus Promineifilaceae bacterium]